MKEKIVIVIPAYNESPVLAEVISAIKKKGYHNIIVVDDGSSDNTYEVAKGAGVIALKHFLNRGKGAAIKTGLEAAKRLNADIVVTIDGDGQHDPAEIGGMVKKIQEGFDVVLGSRSFKSVQMPLFNKIANYVGNVLTFLIYGLWVQDSQSGFRVFSNKALYKMNTSSDRYEYDTEVIREISQNKLSYVEIPISVRYTEYSKNKHTKQSFYNGLKTLFILIRK
jgi:glycosyltransferase involved in cell wall biosynthesis